MGIHGLMSYVRANNQFFDTLKLRDTKIIIDGSNLYNQLCFDSNLDLQHGGDYDAYTAVVHAFFDALSACNIQPYVVLDGGCDPSDKKLDTLKQRARERILKAHSLSKGKGGSVLPLLIKDVFKQVLDSLKVPFVQCFSEADREIVALANEWNCPVLTYDSDFCIFYLNAGYCPFVDFQWKDLSNTKDTQACYIPAKCFRVERLCSHFSHMNKALLPLFAVLIGNDYGNIPALEAFFRKVKFPIGAGSSNYKKHGHMQDLLNWLAAFAEPAEAVESVVKYLKTHEQSEVRELLSHSMEEYQPADVKLEDFFQNGHYVCEAGLKLNLPVWFLEALAKGQLSSFLGDVVVVNRIFLLVQVENMQQPSAHKVSQPIRGAVYRLLLNSSLRAETASLTSKLADRVCVHEFDRTDQTLRKTAVEVPIETLDSWQDNFLLDKLTEATISERLNLLLEILEMEPSLSDTLPHSWRFPIAITCYWIHHCEPKVKLHHLQSLLMGMIYGELRRRMSSTDPDDFPGEKTRAVYDQFLKLKERKAQNNQLDLDAAHIFCQWQSCLQMGLYLNQLLSFPLPEPDLTRLYSGTLVHRLCHEFKSSPSTKDLFIRCPTMDQLYKNLLCAVKSVVPLDFFQNKSISKSSKIRKKK